MFTVVVVSGMLQFCYHIIWFLLFSVEFQTPEDNVPWQENDIFLFAILSSRIINIDLILMHALMLVN